jgi:hypothetical protein
MSIERGDVIIQRENIGDSFFENEEDIQFDRAGVFDCVLRLNKRRAIYVRGHYNKEEYYLYIARIDKFPNVKESGLAERAIEATIQALERSGAVVSSVEAEASPSLVKSLTREGGCFSKNIEVYPISGMNSSSIVISIKKE